MALVELGRKEHQEALPDSSLDASWASMSYREGGQDQGSTRLAASFATGPTAAPGPRTQPTPTLDTTIHWINAFMPFFPLSHCFCGRAR
ncbi:hypothetical protein Alg130_08153 [Pyrenophora tritici-repentis]|nr:hypothetical protein Alg130_08153 [Pyrenophora tritici-repentis]KAI0607523.1 hypothetical protein TUN205_08236 [Pyrenophora tritici-repentis]